MAELPYTKKIRGVALKQNGAEINGGARIGAVDFVDSNVTYNPVTGEATVGALPGGPSAVGAATEVGQRLSAVSDGLGGYRWEKHRGAIVPNLVANTRSAATTNSNNIVAAIAAAYSSGTRTDAVELPAGAYYIDGSVLIEVLYGCSLRGVFRGMGAGSMVFNDVLSSNATGTRLLVTGGALGTNGSKKLFYMRHQSRLTDLEITYVDQVTNATPDPYDWTIYIQDNEPWVHIENVVCTNPYKFIFVNSPATIQKVWGFPLSLGIHLSRISDLVRVQHVQFNYSISYALAPR
jgi:hypothetical protein